MLLALALVGVTELLAVTRQCAVLPTLQPFSFQKPAAIERNRVNMTQQGSQQMVTGKLWQPYLHRTSGVLPRLTLLVTAASAWCEPQLSHAFQLWSLSQV